MAGVIILGQAVDDRTAGVGSERLARCMTKRTQHDGIDVLADGAGEIRNRLARSQTGFVSRQKNTGAAQLSDGSLETDAGPQRRFLEYHAQDLAEQGGRGFAARVRCLEAGSIAATVYTS